MGSGTSIGRVRGLGSAKEGAHHWWRQRVTAGSNLFLTLWFVFSLLRLPGYDYASVHDWLRNSWVAVPMILLIVSVFYHFRLGLQVVIEDYLAKPFGRNLALILNTFVCVALFAIAAVSVVVIAA